MLFTSAVLLIFAILHGHLSSARSISRHTILPGSVDDGPSYATDSFLPGVTARFIKRALPQSSVNDDDDESVSQADLEAGVATIPTVVSSRPSSANSGLSFSRLPHLAADANNHNSTTPDETQSPVRSNRSFVRGDSSGLDTSEGVANSSMFEYFTPPTEGDEMLRHRPHRPSQTSIEDSYLRSPLSSRLSRLSQQVENSQCHRQDSDAWIHDTVTSNQRNFRDDHSIPHTSPRSQRAGQPDEEGNHETSSTPYQQSGRANLDACLSFGTESPSSQRIQIDGDDQHRSNEREARRLSQRRRSTHDTQANDSTHANEAVGNDQARMTASIEQLAAQLGIVITPQRTPTGRTVRIDPHNRERGVSLGHRSVRHATSNAPNVHIENMSNNNVVQVNVGAANTIGNSVFSQGMLPVLQRHPGRGDVLPSQLGPQTRPGPLPIHVEGNRPAPAEGHGPPH